MTFRSDEEDGDAISAFRNYLKVVTDLATDDAFINHDVLEAFNTEIMPWVNELPEPGRLIGSPNTRSIIDRLSERIDDDIHAIKLCSPYFDPDGAALTEIANRWPVSITVSMQKSHVGLSTHAVSAQPTNVSIVPVETVPARFIHAKAVFFEAESSIHLVSGSANISRAALLSNLEWGNAELVTIQEINSSQQEELLSEFHLQDEDLVFPETPPSDEWKLEKSPLKLLHASYVDGIIRVHLEAGLELENITLVTNDGIERSIPKSEFQSAIQIVLPQCPKSIYLRYLLPDGSTSQSFPIWVSDEAILGKSAPERRLSSKLATSLEGGALSPLGMLEILYLLNDHARTPVNGPIRSQRQGGGDDNTIVESYNIDDVFSPDFGNSGGTEPGQYMPGFSETDFLRAFSSYFSLSPIAVDNEHDLPSLDSEELLETNVPSDGFSPEETEKARHEKKQARREEAEKLRSRLLKAVHAVIDAFSSNDFLEGRPITRVVADIKATALLLRKGLEDGVFKDEDFALVTEELWRILFFGDKTQASVLQKLADREDEDTEIQNIASPQLTAALIVWCAPNWGEQAAYAIKFRFSAMLLAAKFPWLLEGGEPLEVQTELKRLCRAMHLTVGYEVLNVAWVNWLRAGKAFSEFAERASAFNQKELANKVTRENVNANELLWQAGEFCVSEKTSPRNSRTKVVVKPLNGGLDKKFMGDWLAPVAELVQSSEKLNMHPSSADALKRIVLEYDNH